LSMYPFPCSAFFFFFFCCEMISRLKQHYPVAEHIGFRGDGRAAYPSGTKYPTFLALSWWPCWSPGLAASPARNPTPSGETMHPTLHFVAWCHSGWCDHAMRSLHLSACRAGTSALWQPQWLSTSCSKAEHHHQRLGESRESFIRVLFVFSKLSHKGNLSG
jgi:hypothetical protein